MDLPVLVEKCAPNVSTNTMLALVKVESSANPFAIGVVKGVLTRQPNNLKEAVATARYLEKSGWNYSIGLVQVNRSNFAKYGLVNEGEIDFEKAFSPCVNLRVGGKILEECYTRANGNFSGKKALQAAFLAITQVIFPGDFQEKKMEQVTSKEFIMRPEKRFYHQMNNGKIKPLTILLDRLDQPRLETVKWFSIKKGRIVLSQKRQIK